MTNTKIILTTLCLFAIAIGVSFAQNPYIDSIHIKVDDKIDISLKKYTSKDIHEEIKTDLMNLNGIISENNSVSDYKSYIINYIPNKSMTISPYEPIEYIDLGSSDFVGYKYQHQCNINTKNYRMIIKFNELDAVFTEVTYSKLENAQDSTAANDDRFKATHNFTYTGDEEKYIKNYDSDGYSNDMIALVGATGVSLVGNRPLTDISASISLVFGKKGIPKNQFDFSTNLYFNFDENRTAYTNNFLNLGYRRNLSNNPDKPSWLGVEAGYLISRHGDFFDENTFKLGINWEVGKYVSINPQLFISGDLEKVTPGIRIGFGF